MISFFTVFSHQTLPKTKKESFQKNIHIINTISVYWSWSPQGVVSNVLDCNIVRREFEHQLRYYVHFRTKTFGKDINPFIFSSFGLNTTVAVFYKDGFDIK